MGTIGLTNQVSEARDSDSLNNVELDSVSFLVDGDIESFPPPRLNQFDGISSRIHKKYDMISPCKRIVCGYGNKEADRNFIMTVVSSCRKSALSRD